MDRGARLSLFGSADGHRDIEDRPARLDRHVIGLGAMGGQITGRLLAAGHTVYGTNRTEARAREVIERGLRWCDTPRQVAEAAQVTFSMVTDDDALRTVATGPESFLAGLSAGSVHLDMSTVSPELSRELADQARVHGAEFLDTPVSGSVPAAADGSLAIMAAGDEAAFHQVEPLLHELGSTVTYVGGNGQALQLKLAVNISLGAQILALSEGVLLAERAGIDRQLAIDVIAGSAVGSPAVRARGPLIARLPETAWFDVRLLHKDIGLTLEAGRQLGTPLPTTETLDRVLTHARELGYEHRDIAVLFQVLANTGTAG